MRKQNDGSIDRNNTIEDGSIDKSADGLELNDHLPTTRHVATDMPDELFNGADNVITPELASEGAISGQDRELASRDTDTDGSDSMNQHELAEKGMQNESAGLDQLPVRHTQSNEDCALRRNVEYEVTVEEDSDADDIIDMFASNAALSNKTEPALDLVKKAREIRRYRERSFRRDRLPTGDHSLGEKQYLESIAEEIRVRCATVSLQIFEIGGLLIDARNILHGGFVDWVKLNFEFSLRTANHFMSVYERFLGRRDAVINFRPTALYVISRRSFPRELREHLIEHADGVHEASVEEFLIAAAKYQAGEIALDSPEVRNLLRTKKKQDIAKRIGEEIDKVLTALDRFKRIIEEMGKECIVDPLLPPDENTRDHWVLADTRVWLQEMEAEIKAHKGNLGKGFAEIQSPDGKIQDTCRLCHYRALGLGLEWSEGAAWQLLRNCKDCEHRCAHFEANPCPDALPVRRYNASQGEITIIT